MTNPYKSMTDSVQQMLNEQLKDRPELQTAFVAPKGQRDGLEWIVDEISYHPDLDSTVRTYKFVLQHPYWREVFRCELSPYPACCAMWQLNNFFYQEPRLEAEDVAWLFNQVRNMSRYLGNIVRVVLNLVEKPRVKPGEFDEYGPAWVYNMDTDYAKDIPPIENPKMKYPHVYTWAKSHKKYAEHLMLNQNTGNIIHFAEVVF